MATTLPSGDELLPADLSRAFVVAAFNSAVGGGSVLVPKGATEMKVPGEAGENPGDFALAAQFMDPSRANAPMVQIIDIRLPADIAADDLLRMVAQRMDYTVNVLDQISPFIADAFVSGQIDNTPVAGRFCVRIFKAAAVLCSALVPAPNYPMLAAYLGAIVRSFEIEGVQVGGLAEPWTRLTVGPWLVPVPKSWETRVTLGPDGRRLIVDLDRAGGDGETLALGRIRWVSDCDSPPAEIAKMMLELQSAGMVVSGMLSMDAEPAAVGPLSIVNRAVYAIQHEGSPPGAWELRMVVSDVNSDVLIVSLLGPSAAANTYAWATNRRALELIVSNVSTQA